MLTLCVVDFKRTYWLFCILAVYSIFFEYPYILMTMFALSFSYVSYREHVLAFLSPTLTHFLSIYFSFFYSFLTFAWSMEKVFGSKSIKYYGKMCIWKRKIQSEKFILLWMVVIFHHRVKLGYEQLANQARNIFHEKKASNLRFGLHASHIQAKV